MGFEGWLQDIDLSDDVKSLYLQAYKDLCNVYGELQVINTCFILDYPIFYLRKAVESDNTKDTRDTRDDGHSENESTDDTLYDTLSRFYIRLQPSSPKGFKGVIALIIHEGRLENVMVFC